MHLTLLEPSAHAGAIAAVIVGAATLGCSLRAGATLLAFYMSSSKLTTLKEELKEVDDEFKKGGQRDWVQVLPRRLAACCMCDILDRLDVSAE